LVAWLIGASVSEPFSWLRPDGTDLTVLLWILASIASALLLDVGAASQLTQTYLSLGLVYYIASRMVRNEHQARRAVLAVCVGLGAVALLSLASPHVATSLSSIPGETQRLGPLGASGVAGINRFAGWLAVGAVLPWVALRGFARPSTLLARALSVVAFVALVATVSKAGLIAVAVGLAGWVALTPKGARTRRAVTTLLVMCIGWVLMPAEVHQRFAAFTQVNSDAYSRVAIWAAGWHMFLAHPFFGVGLGNYNLYAPLYFPQGTGYEEGQAAHNIVIGALAQTGIVGLLLLLLMIWSVARGGLRAIEAGRHAEGSGRVREQGDSPCGEVRQATSTGVFIGYLVFLTACLSVDLQQDRYFLALAGLVHGMYKAKFRSAAS
jgi:O-antigen ligase